MVQNYNDWKGNSQQGESILNKLPESHHRLENRQ